VRYRESPNSYFMKGSFYDNRLVGKWSLSKDWADSQDFQLSPEFEPFNGFYKKGHCHNHDKGHHHGEEGDVPEQIDIKDMYMSFDENGIFGCGTDDEGGLFVIRGDYNPGAQTAKFAKKFFGVKEKLPVCYVGKATRVRQIILFDGTWVVDENQNGAFKISVSFILVKKNVRVGNTGNPWHRRLGRTTLGGVVGD
jgi:hypothetical protein